MVNEKDVRKEVRDLLRDNLTDPVKRRREKGGNWIYTDYPRGDATKPRIGMQDISNTYEALSLGTASRRTNALIQVTVMLDEEGSKFDVDDDGNPEKEEDVLKYYAERIENIITDDTNQNSLRDSIPIDYVLPVDSTTVRPDGENIIKQDITLETQFI